MTLKSKFCRPPWCTQALVETVATHAILKVRAGLDDRYQPVPPNAPCLRDWRVDHATQAERQALRAGGYHGLAGL